jgi:hypothetical protein
VPIGGPEPLSWIDVAKVYERVLGRPIDLVHARPGEPIAGIPAPVLPLLAGLDTYKMVFDSAASARAVGITLTPLEAIARRQLAGAGSC